MLHTSYVLFFIHSFELRQCIFAMKPIASTILLLVCLRPQTLSCLLLLNLYRYEAINELLLHSVSRYQCIECAFLFYSGPGPICKSLRQRTESPAARKLKFMEALLLPKARPLTPLLPTGVLLQ